MPTRELAIAESRSGRCLLIVVDSGFAIRNILRTRVLERLRQEAGLRLVVVSPIHDQAFCQEFAYANLVVEPLLPCPFSFGKRLLGSLRKDLWAHLSQVGPYLRKRAGRFGFAWHMALLRGVAAMFFRGDLPALFAWLTRMAQRSPANLAPLLARYQPDLIFSVNLFNPDLCLELSAHRHGIPVVTMIQSWDNPTTKGPLPFIPERVIVWNEILQQEMVAHHQVPRAAIRLSGLPQADLYLDRPLFASRELFFQRLGLDPQKQLITYTTGARRLVTMDNAVVTLLYQALAANRFVRPCQLLVRLHPKDHLARYRSLHGLPDISFQEPGQRAGVTDGWNPTHEEMYGLAELMLHSRVVVNVASTITLDAAAFDTPVVNIAFDGVHNLPKKRSCRRFYEFDHYRKIVATGGAAIARSAQEMVEWINRYLDDPTLHQAGRRRIVEEQFWKLDGQAGIRVAEHILDVLNRKERPE